MTAIKKLETDAITCLMRAIDLLDTAGYSCWFLEEFSVENLSVSLDGFPTELPLLPGEVELMAAAYANIMALAGWDDAPNANAPMFPSSP